MNNKNISTILLGLYLLAAITGYEYLSLVIVTVLVFYALAGTISVAYQNSLTSAKIDGVNALSFFAMGTSSIVMIFLLITQYTY